MTRSSQPRPDLLRGLNPLLLSVVILLPAVLVRAAESAPVFPAKGLTVYVDYDGLGNHAAAWKATAARAMLEGTPAGEMTSEIARQVLDYLAKAQPDPKLRGAEAVALERHVLDHGFALGMYDDGESAASCVLQIKNLGAAAGRERLGSLAGVASRLVTKAGGKVVDGPRARGRTMQGLKNFHAFHTEFPQDDPDLAMAWWFEKDDLIVVFGPTRRSSGESTKDAPLPLPDRVTAVLDAMEGKTSSVATHPGLAAALAEGKEIKGFEANGLFFVEFGRAPDVMAQLATQMFFQVEYGSLPSGKYIHDDVQYFDPSPDSAQAKRAKQKQEARMRALGLEPSKPTDRSKDATPKGTPTPPARVAAEGKAKGDPAVARTGTKPAGAPEGDNENPTASLKSLGLDRVTRVVGRWGFQGKALLTDVRVETPAPHRGLTGVFDQVGFRSDRLPPLPRGTGAFLVNSCDLSKAYDQLLPFWSDAALEGIDGVEVDQFAHGLDLIVFEMTGQRLREDLLEHLGPTWCLYAEPRGANGARTQTFPTLLVDVDDAKAFAKVLDSLAKRVNRQIAGLMGGEAKPPANDLPVLALVPLPAPERGYTLTSPAGIVSFLGKTLSPTILFGESRVAVAATPALARKALALATDPAGRWEPTGELTEALACLPARLTSLTVGDPQDCDWPELAAALPKLVQHLVTATEALEGSKPNASPGAKVLGLLGVPRAGGFRLRVDPAHVPAASALRKSVFPSVMATAIDDHGMRFIAREAIPFACAGPRFAYRANTNSVETLSVRLSPFLFPCVGIELKHRPQQKDHPMSMEIGWKFSIDDNDE